MTDIINVNFSQDMQTADEMLSRLKYKARAKGIPITGLFEFTPRCTLDCEMCYVHLSPSQMSHGELSKDD